MLPFSLGFTCPLLWLGVRLHCLKTLSICPFLPMASQLTYSKGLKPWYGPQDSQMAPLCLWRHHLQLLPFLALFQAPYRPRSASSLWSILFSHGLAAHRLVCPDCSSLRSSAHSLCFFRSLLNYQHNGGAFSGYWISNNNRYPIPNTLSSFSDFPQ